MAKKKQLIHMKNSLLKKAKQKLASLFDTEWYNDNILLIRSHEDNPPFAQLIYQAESGEKALISVSVACEDPQLIAKLVLDCMHAVNTDLAEPFFISKDGNIFYGEEAYLEHELENSNKAYFLLDNHSISH